MIAKHTKLMVNGVQVTGKDEDRPAYIPIRAWRQIMKYVMLTVAKTWHSRYLPLHFKRTAYFRYPGVYKRRTNAYFLRNFVKSGEDKNTAVEAARAAHNPLVFTGTLQQATQLAVFRAYQTRATIKIEKLYYVNKRPSVSQPDMLAELGFVNSQESTVLRSLGQTTLTEAIRNFAATRQLPTLIT